MKRILYIHTEQKIKYGSHYINDLIIDKLRRKGFKVDSIYPKKSLSLIPKNLVGISRILFFYSLITKKKMLNKNKYDIIQGTTYTPLAFLGNSIPIISLFGSTTWGFLKNVPTNNKLKEERKELALIYYNLKKEKVIQDMDDVRESLKDISKIEIYVAKNSDAVIATSKKVKEELVQNKVPSYKIHVIHNAIEDYWFKKKINKKVKPVANLVYHGRIGDDAFTIKLKGVNRLIYILSKFPNLNKKIIALCNNRENYSKVFSKFLKTKYYLSLEKSKIPHILIKNYADIYVNTGRYEGFCLSLIEAMSQGLIPIIFPIGVAPEIIKNNYNGYLVKNLEEMEKRIKSLLYNQKKRKQMAERCIKTTYRFKSDKIADKYERIYDRVINLKKSEEIKILSGISKIFKNRL